MVIVLGVWLALVLGMLILLPRREDAKPVVPVELKPDPTPSTDPKTTHWCELKKLEYERAAERYESIYRAIWQNFSYMAVVAGGILTFGVKTFANQPMVFALALTPLVFWFLATYLPLDNYGDAARTRLAEIENEINAIYFPGRGDPRLGHFLQFKQKQIMDPNHKWRVQDAVGIAGRLIMAGWLFWIVIGVRNRIETRRVPTADVARNVEASRDTLGIVSQRLHSVDSLLRVTLECLRAPVPPSGRKAC